MFVFLKKLKTIYKKGSIYLTVLFFFVINLLIVLSYCFEYRKNTEDKNIKVVKTKRKEHRF